MTKNEWKTKWLSLQKYVTSFTDMTMPLNTEVLKVRHFLQGGQIKKKGYFAEGTKVLLLE